MSEDYSAESIELLTDQQHVRLRTQVYLGNMHLTEYEVPIFLDDKFSIEKFSFRPALYKAIGELCDNSCDEFSQISIPNKTLKIQATPNTGEYTISDNGRGVPIDKHKSGKYTPEVVFGSLRSGRNFSDNKKQGVLGQNGMGSSITCYCSKEFNVLINRDNKKYKQAFKNGCTKISKPSITEGSNKTGTEVSFILDEEVFKDVSLPERLMNNRAIELAATNPDVTVHYNDKKYKFKKGFDDIVKTISKSYFKFEFSIEKTKLEFFVIFDINNNIDEKIFTWVNSSMLFDGGICNTQFLNTFIDSTIEHLHPQAKKLKCDVTKNDIRQNLLVFGNLKISDPEYDAQSKTRLTNPNLKKEMTEMISTQWSSFVRRNKEWFEQVLERAKKRHSFSEDDKALKEMKKSFNKKVAKLLDASSNNRFECKLLIVEGDSAKGQISDVRDAKTIGVYPLSGKINNVYGCSLSELIKMEKLKDLLSVIGLIPGKKANRENLNYGEVIIATDADPDGGDIFALLVNLFYHFWPELFDKNYKPYIKRLVVPNIVAVKGDKRVHFSNRGEFEKVKEKYKGWEITYLKGLGGMVIEDWEMVLKNKDGIVSIPIIDDGYLKGMLELLFSDNANNRKEWLQIK